MKINSINILFLLISLSYYCVAKDSKLVDVKIITSVESIEPGDSFKIAVKFKIKKGWHIYWQNPGDAGLATKFTLEYDGGFEFVPGDIQYPIPEKLVKNDIAEYIYKNETMLFYWLKAPDFLKTENDFYDVKADVSWLVCKDGCIPGKKVLNLKVKTGKKTITNKNWEKLTKKYQDLLPGSSKLWNVSIEKKDSLIILKIIKNDDDIPDFQKLEFYPATENVFCEYCRQSFKKINNGYELEIKIVQSKLVVPDKFEGILVADKEWDEKYQSKGLIFKIRQ